MVDIFVNRGLTSTTWNDSNVRHPVGKTHVPLGFDVVHVDLKANIDHTEYLVCQDFHTTPAQWFASKKAPLQSLLPSI